MTHSPLDNQNVQEPTLYELKDGLPNGEALLKRCARTYTEAGAYRKVDADEVRAWCAERGMALENTSLHETITCERIIFDDRAEEFAFKLRWF